MAGPRSKAFQEAAEREMRQLVWLLSLVLAAPDILAPAGQCSSIRARQYPENRDRGGQLHLPVRAPKCICPRIRNALKPCGNVNSVAEDVAVFDNYIALMDADSS